MTAHSARIAKLEGANIYRDALLDRKVQAVGCWFAHNIFEHLDPTNAEVADYLPGRPKYNALAAWYAANKPKDADAEL